MKNYVKTFESFQADQHLFEGKYPVPRKWETITPARYNQEKETMLWCRKNSDQKEHDAKREELGGNIYIWDWLLGVPLEDGKRPPIVADKSDTKNGFHIISKQKISGINASAVIGTPIKVGKFEVAQYDLPEKMNWWEAEYCCVQLGNGWYLPDKKQIEEMIKVAEELGLATGEWYWGSGNPRSNNSAYQWATNGTVDNIDMHSAGAWECRCRPIKG